MTKLEGYTRHITVGTHQILIVVDCYIDSDGEGADGEDGKHTRSDVEQSPLENHFGCDWPPEGSL